MGRFCKEGDLSTSPFFFFSYYRQMPHFQSFVARTESQYLVTGTGLCTVALYIYIVFKYFY